MIVLYFTCDHRKIICPLVAVATRENKFSMVTREIKKKRFTLSSKS